MCDIATIHGYGSGRNKQIKKLSIAEEVCFHFSETQYFIYHSSLFYKY